MDLSQNCKTKSDFLYYGCDKVGAGRFQECGFCSDAFEPYHRPKKSDKRKTGRLYRRIQSKKKDERLRNIISYDRYNPAVGYIDYGYVDGIWKEVGNHIKYPRDSNFQRYLKRQSNKKIRKHKGTIPKGNFYRKMFEYWWQLY